MHILFIRDNRWPFGPSWWFLDQGDIEYLRKRIGINRAMREAHGEKPTAYWIKYPEAA